MFRPLRLRRWVLEAAHTGAQLLKLEGIKQKGKDLVDPICIPYIGAAVATYEAGATVFH